MGAPLHGSIPLRKASALASGAQVLCNLQLDTDEEAIHTAGRPRRPQAPDARPPGGVLVVAALSAVSGAIMGMVFGGYLTLAAAVVLSLAVGLAVGMWIGGLGR